MPHFVHSAAINQVADETMSVSGHGNQVHVVDARKFDDFVRWLTHRQHTTHHKTFAPRLRATALKISAIYFDFLALGKIELLEIPRDPAIGNVHEQETGSGHSCQWLNMIEDRLICRAVLHGDKDGVIHGCVLKAWTVQGSCKRLCASLRAQRCQRATSR